MRRFTAGAGFIAVAASLALTLTGCGGGGNQATTSAPDTTTSSSAPDTTPDTAPPSSEAAPTGPPASQFGDGTYVVGKDIQAGTYHSDGAALPGVDCYWQRDRDANGQTASVIANHAGREAVTVTISPDDGVFHSVGCKTWALAAK